MAVTGTPVSTLIVSIFTGLIPFFVNYYIEFQQFQDQAKVLNKPAYVEHKTEVFDFIVVGIGTAGSVVVNRLSKSFNVLALEAGGFPGLSFITEVPLFYAALQDTKMDYQYETVDQKNSCLAFNHHRRKLPRGKAVGGSSNINNMMYVRGHAQDFDIWANITQNPIWSGESVLKYFKRSEDYHGNYPEGVGTVHSTGNEYYVGTQYMSPITPHFFKALKARNISTGDVNNFAYGEVFGYPEVTIKNGERVGGYQAFIKPILHRKTLSIYPFSTVTKIHFNSRNRAVGVTYHRHGHSHYARARYEIIICAGVVESPKLLMLSGVGPTKHLQSVGITNIVDLPVGKGLMAHSYIPLNILIDKPLSFIPKRDLNAANLLKYYTTKGGPVATSCVRFAIGYTYTNKEPAPKAPGIYFVFNGIGGGATSSHEVLSTSRFSDVRHDVLKTYYEPIQSSDGFIVEVVCVRPMSRGHIRLRSSDVHDMPLIDPRFFHHPDDIKCSVDGFIFLMKLIESSTAFKSINARLSSIPFPGCENVTFKSRDYWECYIRHVTGSPDAATSSCRMGRDASDPKAVVDSKLRVIHTKRLRVIDSSIMPVILTGNPQAPTVMIGEVGSQLILNRWQHRKRSRIRKRRTPKEIASQVI